MIKFKNAWQSIFLTVLVRALKLASPAIVTSLRDFARELRVSAQATPNQWDDLLADILCAVVQADELSEQPDDG